MDVGSRYSKFKRVAKNAIKRDTSDVLLRTSGMAVKVKICIVVKKDIESVCVLVRVSARFVRRLNLRVTMTALPVAQAFQYTT